MAAPMPDSPLSTAADVMTAQVVTVSPTTPVFDVIDLLLEHSISAVPVVDSTDAIVGVLSEQDCMKVIAAATYDDQGREELLQAHRHMSEVTSVPPDEEIYRIVDRFRDPALQMVAVLDGDALVGLVSRRDLLVGLKAMESEFLALLSREHRDPRTPNSFFGATRHDASEVASRLNR